MLLLLAYFVVSSSDYFLGICNHPSFVTQSNISKTLIVAYGVFSDALTFPSSPFSCASFSVLVSVDCWMFSLGEPFFFSCRLHYYHFYFFFNKIMYLINSIKTKNSFQPLPFRRFFYMNNYFLRFICLNNSFFCFLMILLSPFS